MEQYPLFSGVDEDEIDVEDAFGEHDVEYWVRAGNRLIPATEEQVAAIREHEALRRLTRWQRLEAAQAEQAQQAEQASRRTAGRGFRVRWLVGAMLRRSFTRAGQEAEIALPAARAERIDTGAAPTDAGRRL